MLTERQKSTHRDRVQRAVAGRHSLSVSIWVRFPGGPWMATSERSEVKVAKALRGIGLDAAVVHRDIDLREEIAGRLRP